MLKQLTIQLNNSIKEKHHLTQPYNIWHDGMTPAPDTYDTNTWAAPTLVWHSLSDTFIIMTPCKPAYKGAWWHDRACGLRVCQGVGVIQECQVLTAESGAGTKK